MTTSPNISVRRRSRLRNLLLRAEREGAALQFWARTGTLAAVALFLTALNRWDKGLIFVLVALFVFFLVGLLQYALVKRRFNPPWLGYVVGTFDIVMITALLILPNPFVPEELPPAMQLREAGFKYLLIFVCLGALNLSPRLAAWLGVAAAMSWLSGVIWVATNPGTIIPASQLYTMTLGERLRFYLNPNFINAFDQAANVFVILIMAAIIALVVSRSRHLADDYVRAERARANLARHFSPNVVDELASEDEPFGPVRRQDIAIVFADIVGFTTYSEDHHAEDVFELLRQFHRRMEHVVFDHGGTVDNFIGDCIMATFGVPHATSDDAIRAIRCCAAMIDALNKWNDQRVQGGLAPVDVRIGAHYGSVVLGAVGSERSLSMAVVGDTVNVASRLQVLCRELDAGAAFGAELMSAALTENNGETVIDATDRGIVHIRGREGTVHVWTLPRAGSVIDGSAPVTAPT